MQGLHRVSSIYMSSLNWLVSTLQLTPCTSDSLRFVPLHKLVSHDLTPLPMFGSGSHPNLEGCHHKFPPLCSLLDHLLTISVQASFPEVFPLSYPRNNPICMGLLCHHTKYCNHLPTCLGLLHTHFLSVC